MILDFAWMGSGAAMVRRRSVLRAALLGAAGSAAGPLAVIPAARAADEHPFLLVSPGDFATLRGWAATDPWETWATAAVTLAGTTYVKKPSAPGEPGEPNVGDRAKQMTKIAGSASLSFILDSANSGAHRQKILDLIQLYGSDIYPDLDTGTWEGTVAPSGALFHLVIGFDVIYNTLSVNEVSAAEAVLDTAAGWFYTYRNNTSWQAARIGGYGIWAAFKKDAVETNQPARLSESVTQLRNHFAAMSESDGAYLTGPTYAGHRLGSPGDRDSKAYYVDVLTRIGAHDFYTDNTYRKLMEHYSGHLTTPVLRNSASRDEFTFGDSWTGGGAVHRSARTYSADKFGPVAAAGAGWSLRGVPARATLPLITAYALTTQAPQTTATVPSRVFRGAGAWFYQPSTSNLALAGALWCPKKANAVEHQHKDTNALHLTAYGEHVLRNAGYAGYGTAAAGFAYDVIARRAVVNNTVLLDYDAKFTDDHQPPPENDHVTVTSSLPGAGVVEDLLWRDLDYACGDSGAALPNGRHQRNFVFVHPNATCHGYWLVFDEVDANVGNVPASVAWHPNSKTDPQAVTADTEYVSQVDANPCTSNNVKLSVFLATPPIRASIRSGPFAESVVPSVAGRYLYCSYPTDSAGVKNIVTVLFPFDDNHTKATMRRVSGSGFTGASIAHAAGSIDYALESNGMATVSVEGVTWRGLAAVFRLSDGNLDYYLVRKGNSFISGGQGFTASAKVSANCKGKGGRIRNGGASQVSVTFYHPGLTKVRLDGKPAAVTASGIGWLTVTVPAGTWQFELVTVVSYNPVADTFVRGGRYASDNYGNLSTVTVKADANPDYQREAFLRFDLSGYTGDSVASAKVRLYTDSVGGGSYTMEASHVPDTTWTESSLTWTTKPASSTVLAITTAPAAGAVVSVDVTNQVNAILSGTGTRALAVRLRILENGASNFASFGTKENADPTRRPVIELTP